MYAVKGHGRRFVDLRRTYSGILGLWHDSKAKRAKPISEHIGPMFLAGPKVN